MKANLMNHQHQGVLFAHKNNGIAAFHYEVGCGKTLTALAAYESFKKQDPDLKLLVICPISLIHGAWVKEIEKFTDYKWWDIHSKVNNTSFPGKADIWILNFEYLINKAKFLELRKWLSLGEFMVIIDESSKMKNHTSVTVDRLNGEWKAGKYIQGIKDMCRYRIELTGTPAPNTESEYWAQMYFLNPAILGNNFYKFRNLYYSLQRGKEIVKGAVFDKQTLREMFNKGYKYEFDESKRQEFFDKLKPWCHVIKAKDCLDLPEAIDEYRVFDMESDQARVYKEMKTEFVAEIRHELDHQIYVNEIEKAIIQSSIVVANIILTKMMKLRQITSGFAITESGIGRALTTKIPEKLKILLDIIEECGNEQIIIWCQFRYEIVQIVTTIKEIANVAELHGGIAEKDRIHHINNFLSGACRFLVAHPDSAAHGLTFVNCNRAVYYSLSYSYEEYSQSRGRIMRHGQKKNCVYFHILARSTVDEDVLAVCQKKQTKQDIAERFLK